MNSSIQIFSNNEFTIRTIKDNGEFWFVAKDVAEALDYSESSIDSVNKLCASVPEMWKGRKRFLTPGGEQEMLCLTEQGLYFFLGRSDKPKALPYQVWVAGNVIPSIRQTGNYITNPSNNADDITLRKAAILQHMLDNPINYAINDISRAVISHEIFRFMTGKECLAMLPEATEARYSATEIGKMFGVSAKKIGTIAKNYNLKSKQGESNEYGTWICNKSKHSSHECLTFAYNDKAVSWFKQHRELLI